MAEGSSGQVRWAVRPGGTTAAQEEWHRLDEQLQVRFEELFKRLANEGLIRNPDRCAPVTGSNGLWRISVGRVVILACRGERETILLSVLEPLRKAISETALAHAQMIRAEDIGGHV